MSAHGCRPEVVIKVVEGAIEAMSDVAQAEGATNDEIMSAYFTLIRRGVLSALMVSTDRAATCGAMRVSLFTILADMADVNKLH